ncbi:MAG: PspC domain-containing protein [SAR324 cluster bacterium]|nr:PspC domain-containing protein [SAR324 cluster bacterium]
MLAYYNTALVIFGGLTLIFGIWTFFGLLTNSPKKKQQRRKGKKAILGVCADFSWQIGIPLWIVRIYAVLYAPLLLGIIFYFLYYSVMKLRKPQVPLNEERSVNVTRMEIHRF